MERTKETLEEMRNLGPKTSERLRTVGIENPEQLIEIGAVEAYCRLKALYPDTTASLVITAIEGAIMDVHWQDVPSELSDALKFEAWEIITANKKTTT